MRYKAIILGFLLSFACLHISNAQYSIIYGYQDLSVDGGYIYAIANNGTLYMWDTDMQCTPIMDNVTDVSKNYAVKSDDTLWTWDYKTLEPQQIDNSVESISSGAAHTLIVKKDHSLWGIGSNRYGQLAQGELNRDIETQKAGYSDRVKRHRGNDAVCSPSEFSNPVKIMDNVKDAKAGEYYSLVLKTDGSVWSFGGETYGELGDGNVDIITNIPTKVFNNADKIFTSGGSSFLITDNILYRWGSNYTGMIGRDEADCQLSPVKYAYDVKDVINRPGYNLLVKSDSGLWIYGDTQEPQELFIDGNIKINAPMKIADNIESICGNIDAIDGTDDIIAVLKNDGTLYKLNVNKDNSGEANELIDLVPIKNNVYTDINTSTPHLKAILKLTDMGILNGYDDFSFCPDRYVTRAQMAKLLVTIDDRVKLDNVNNLELIDIECSFQDVDNNHWAKEYIYSAANRGLINGYSDEIYKPEEPVTYGEAITMIMRLLGYEKMCAMDGGYPEGYLKWSEKTALANGFENVEYNKAMSRAEISQLFYNALSVKTIYTGIENEDKESIINYLDTKATILMDYLL